MCVVKLNKIWSSKGWYVDFPERRKIYEKYYYGNLFFMKRDNKNSSEVNFKTNPINFDMPSALS